MGFATAADIPVVLIGDIDRGGVIAQLVGTHVVLPPEDRAMIRAFGINKFRGDTSLFAEGMDIIAKATVLGVCGGYQMLGQEIIDDDGIEGAPTRVQGLGHLDITTVMKPEKRLARSTATYLPTGDKVTGYEIHIGKTDGPDCDRPWLSLEGRGEGASSPNNRVQGCYLHGLFTANAFRTSYLQKIGAAPAPLDYAQGVTQTLDALAEHLETHMDIDQLLALAGEV